MISIIRNKNSELIFGIIIILFIVLLSVIYGYILYKYPYQEGGDLLFHTWISNQITKTGNIPLSNPTNNNVNLYSLTPLFHILSSSVSQITGLETVDTMFLLNLVLVALFILSLYILSNVLFNNKVISLLAVLIVFLLSNELFFYLVPSNLTLVLFIILVYLLVKFISNNNITYKHYLLYYLLLVALIFIHHINASYALTILAGIIIVLILFTKEKRKSFLLLLTIMAALLTFIGINLSLFINQTFPINTSDPSFKINNGSLATDQKIIHNLSQPLSNFTNSIFWIFFLFGIFLIFYYLTKKSEVNVRYVIIISWITTALLILYQFTIGLDFLFLRAVSFLVPIVSIVTALGVYTVIAYLPNKYSNTKIIILMIILILSNYLLASRFITLNHNLINNGIARENIKELQLIKKNLKNGIVLSDPITTYLLVSIADMKSAYQYEHTDLIRNVFIKWDNMQKLFYGPKEELIQYINKVKPDYIVISARTRAYFDKADFSKFDNPSLFKRVYESQKLDQKNYRENFDTKYPYYSVYQFLQ